MISGPVFWNAVYLGNDISKIYSPQVDYRDSSAVIFLYETADTGTLVTNVPRRYLVN
jgi:hypothetical protein